MLSGTIGGPGWSLALHGSFGYGSPMQVRFQGKGLVGGEEWIYDYIGWLVPVWPNSNAATAARGDRRLGGAHGSAFEQRRHRPGGRGGVVLCRQAGLACATGASRGTGIVPLHSNRATPLEVCPIELARRA